MSRAAGPGRLVAAVTAVVVGLALWFGAATPGAAVATEAPSPPALASFGCTLVGHHGPSHADACPAVARGSSSAVLGTVVRKAPLATTVAGGGLAVVGIAAAVALIAVVLERRRGVGRVAARAPPVVAS